MTPTTLPHRPSRLALVAAFAAIYVIWGSTYLVIRIGVETLPPFLMAGVRFCMAGAAVYLFLRWRGVPHPDLRQWRAGVLVGSLMLAGGNGLVTWAEQSVPSAVAAVIIATVPLWMTLLAAWPLGRERIAPRTLGGLLFGLAGVVVLVAPGGDAVESIAPLGAAALLLAALSWSVGSLLSRSAPLPASPMMSAAVQMLTGGAVLLVWGSAAGEWNRVGPHSFTLEALGILLYLSTLGSIVALGAYVWLMRVTSAAAVSTYAFVNPVVAVILGWALAGERFGPRELLATGLVVGAVGFLQGSRLLAGRLRRRRRDLPLGENLKNFSRECR